MKDDLNEVKNKIKHPTKFINGRYCRYQPGAATLEVWNGETWDWMTYREVEKLPKIKKSA